MLIQKVEKEGQKMKIVDMSPDELVPYSRNAKAHPPGQVQKIANSIKRFGWTGNPIVVDRNKVVIIGHGRLLAAKQLNLETVPVVFADDMTEEDVKAYRLADNKTNESEWLENYLSEELAELDIAGIDMSEFGFDLGGTIGENPYTQKTDIPQYTITGEDVTLCDLYQDTKTKELIAEIEGSDLGEEAKQFLKVAAYRHVIFNYQKIAEYYAKADRQTQELMEKSALVIIDIDDAIKNGYSIPNHSEHYATNGKKTMISGGISPA